MAAAALTVAVRARADENHVTFRVDCPPFGEEWGAALEAKGAATLAAGRAGDGEVRIECEGTSATVTWAPVSSGIKVEHVTAEDETALADVILLALDTLISDSPGPQPVAPDTAPPAPQPVAPDTAPPGPQPPISPVNVPEAPSLRDAAVRDVATTRHFAGLVGADAELWTGTIPIAVGGTIGGSWWPRSQWGFRGAVGGTWGIAEKSPVTAWGLRGEAGVEGVALSWLVLGAGVVGRWLSARDGPDPRLQGISGGLSLSARYVAPTLGPVDLSLGLRLDVLARPIVVEMSGQEQFRIPTVVAGVAVEARLPSPRSAPP